MQGAIPYLATSHAMHSNGLAAVVNATTIKKGKGKNKKSSDTKENETKTGNVLMKQKVRSAVSGRDDFNRNIANLNMSIDIGNTVGSVPMEGTESSISNNSEWVLFNPFGDEEEEEEEESIAESILSTRLSATPLQSPFRVSRQNSFNTAGYVISDFDESYKSGRPTEYDALEEEDEDEDEDDDDDETDDGYDCEDASLFSDPLTDDIRSGFENIQRSRINDIENRKHDELVNKINQWKHDVRSVNTLKNERDRKRQDNKKKQRKRDDERIKNINTNKVTSRKDLEARQREIKAFKKVVSKMCPSLKREKDRIVEHEGIFMNNPELDSCVPGYWKRLMLDNLIQYTNEPTVATIAVHRSIFIDNTTALNNRKFWEPEENGSSTGLEGGSILGF